MHARYLYNLINFAHILYSLLSEHDCSQSSNNKEQNLFVFYFPVGHPSSRAIKPWNELTIFAVIRSI